MPNHDNPDAAYLPLIQETEFEPIFILGDHRTGTTLFYKMMVASERFNFVDFYHITRYREIVRNHCEGREETARVTLAGELESAGLQDRIFDRIEVSPGLPEEYCYILKKNPRFWYLPRLTKRSLPNLLELCRKVQFISDRQRPLLLKNPWDFPNFLFLKEAFPNARFIFVHRHPVAVHNSKLKAMRSALARKNRYTAFLAKGYARLFKQPYQLLLARFIFYSRLGVNLLLQYATLASRYFLRHSPQLPAAAHLSIRYEDLCDRPDEVMDNVLGYLGLQPPPDLSYEEMIQPRPLQLLPDVARKRARINRRLRPYLAHLGYSATP